MPQPITSLLFSLSFETSGEKSESPVTIANVSMCSFAAARSMTSTTIRMSALFLPESAFFGISISSIADSWNCWRYSR